jgi:ABC transporter substrate binding protein
VRRRDFITLVGGAALAWPLAGRAQQAAMPVFGILLVFSRESGRTFTEPLRAYMQALGYIEGRNIAFDFRYADGKVERLPTLAAAQRPAVIATFGDATGLAVKAATTTVPIVSMSEDLVRAKLVTNMRQPGGNIMGASALWALSLTPMATCAQVSGTCGCVDLAACDCALQGARRVAAPARRRARPGTTGRERSRCRSRSILGGQASRRDVAQVPGRALARAPHDHRSCLLSREVGARGRGDRRDSVRHGQNPVSSAE